MIGKKTLARICAIQILYIYQFEDKNISIDELKQDVVSLYEDKLLGQEIFSDDKVPEKIRIAKNHLENLLSCCVSNIDLINDLIKTNMVSEEVFSRQSKLILTIMRMAITELLFMEHTPKKVVINEFTNISSSMLSDADIGIVNAVLDKISSTKD